MQPNIVYDFLSGKIILLQVLELEPEPFGKGVAECHIFISTKRHNIITEDRLVENVCISLYHALVILKVTTKRVNFSAIFPILVRYRIDPMFQVKLIIRKYTTNKLW